jgi:hypothetical protein
MEDHFDFQKLRIQQPGKLLSNRASYQILDHRRQLLATATETEAHNRLKVISKAMPDTRVLAVTTAAGEPILTLIKQTSTWITDLQGPDGELVGRIRTEGTRRVYTFLDAQDGTVGRAEGDLALKHFSVKGTGGEFARVRKTWAGLTKEVLTASDHYKVDFTGPVPAAIRTLTVMMPIVLDLTLYGPT